MAPDCVVTEPDCVTLMVPVGSTIEDTGWVVGVEMVMVSARAWPAHKLTAMATRDVEERKKLFVRGAYSPSLVLVWINKFMEIPAA